MPATLIHFTKQPEFGFAHHLYCEDIMQVQNDLQHSFVLVYVKSGHLTADIYGQTFHASAGSLLILFRHIPFKLHSTYAQPQDYCSIQVYTDYSFSYLDDTKQLDAGFSGLALPVITPPCPEVESIKKDMLSIISDLSISRSENSFRASMLMCGILSRLDNIYRQKLYKGGSAATYWENKIKHYIADNINRQISLTEIAKQMDRTPNYLNNIFHIATGLSIHQFINQEKMKLTAALMESNGISFPTACENVGISDISHGYRLFKKHMGVTPKEYIGAEHSRKKY